jgi:hypothetical protein
MMTPATAIARTALTLLALTLLAALMFVAGGCSESDAVTTTTQDQTTRTTEKKAATSTTEKATTTSATTPSFPPTVTHQQDQSRFVYSGKWRTIDASSASGKSLTVADSSKSLVTIKFYGTGISWIAKMSPAYGKAEVTVDGGSPQTVDLYSAKTQWKKTVWKNTDLELGDHTVTIAWTGKKSSGAEATNINVDAIVIKGVLTATYEQDNPKFGYAGSWKTTKSSSSSGGSFFQANAKNSLVTVRFTGTRLVWLGRTGTGYGQARVSLDGGPDSTVDLYSESAKSKQEIWDSGVLAYGTHTITIEWSGTKGTDAQGTAINVDGFRVTGSLK